MSTSNDNGERTADNGQRLNTRGINLIAALFILVALSAVGILVYRSVITEQETSLRHLYSGEALYIAEAGVAWATHNLEKTCDWGQVTKFPDCSGLPLTAKPALCQVALANGTAYVSVSTEGSGAVDGTNNRDAADDSDSCRQIYIESVGRRLGTSGRILAERRIRHTVD